MKKFFLFLSATIVCGIISAAYNQQTLTDGSSKLNVTAYQIAPFTGSYAGSVATVTFPITFASAPTVIITTTTADGTTILNDAVWVTNITTSTCIVGYRTAAGISSGATLTFNGIAVGNQ